MDDRHHILYNIRQVHTFLSVQCRYNWIVLQIMIILYATEIHVFPNPSRFKRIFRATEVHLVFSNLPRIKRIFRATEVHLCFQVRHESRVFFVRQKLTWIF